MPRFTRPLIILAAFLVGLVVAFAVVTWLANSGRDAKSISTIVIGGPFNLVRHDGAAVDEKILKGKPTLMFFGFTHCPDICPTALFEMSEIMRALGNDADRTQAFFVSVDPERDTPAQLKLYLSSFDPHISGLTGSDSQIAQVVKNFRVYAKKVPLKDGDYTMDHTALVYLFDRDGRFVAPFNMKRKPDEAAADLRRYF